MTGGRRWRQPLIGGWEWALVLQSWLTALAGGFNAARFLIYAARQRRRRLGAFTLAVISLAFMLQSLFLGLLPSITGSGAGEMLESAKLRFFVGLLPLAASLLVLSFVMARLKKGGPAAGRSGA